MAKLFEKWTVSFITEQTAKKMGILCETLVQNSHINNFIGDEQKIK